MADNTQLPIPQTLGDLIATDEIGGIKFQRIKIITGADGVNDGDVSASNPLPIIGTVTDGVTPADSSILLVGGITAGGVAQAFETNASGHLNISDGGSSITVDSGNSSLEVNASNVKGKFRESFQGTVIDPTKWTSSVASGDLLFLDGNTVGTSYLVISKSPLAANNETSIETIQTFEMPLELSIGAHLSQRTVGQEFSIEIVDTDAPDPDVSDIAISSISQATTVLTVNTATPHGLVVGKSVGIRGVSDSRLNFAQVVVATTPSPTQFTVTAGPNGNITSQTLGPITNGFVYFRERLGRSKNGISQIFENVTATNASLYVRSNSGDSFPSGTVAGNHSVSVNTSASVQIVNAPYNYGFTPTTEYRLGLQADRVNWLDVAVDSLNASTSRLLRTQVVPDPSKLYKFRIRTKNTASMVRPVARIVSAVKTGTTTATITTDVPHGLNTTSFVQIYGVRDQAATAFPNLTVATQVASVPTTTTFTIVIGTAATVTSYGGFVSICDGTALIAPNGAIAQVVQSVSVIGGFLTAVGSAAWAGLLIGDTVQMHGVNNNTNGAPVVAGVSIDGAYKVRNIATTSLELEPIDSRTLTTLGSTNCGGGVIKRTDLRVSFVRVFDYERLRVESAPRASNDTATALPVNITGGNSNVAISSGTLSTLQNGQTAHSTASTGSPVRIGGRVNTAVDTTLIAGDASDLFITSSGQAVVRDFASAELDWVYHNAGAPITTTSTVALAVAAGAGVRRFLTAIQLNNIGTASVTALIQDGATTLHTITLAAGATRDIVFPTPLKTSANAALNLNVTVTAGGSLSANAQGFNGV